MLFALLVLFMPLLPLALSFNPNCFCRVFFFNFWLKLFQIYFVVMYLCEHMTSVSAFTCMLSNFLLDKMIFRTLQLLLSMLHILNIYQVFYMNMWYWARILANIIWYLLWDMKKAPIPAHPIIQYLKPCILQLFLVLLKI